VFKKECRTTCRVLVRKPVKKRLLRGRRHKWENSMMNHKEIGWEGMDWIYLPENREDGGHCECGSESLRFIICRGVFTTSWGTVSFSRRTLLHFISVHYITLNYITLHYVTLHYITLHYIALHYITLCIVTLFCGSITLCSLNFEVNTVAVISMLHILSIVAFKGNNRWTVQLVWWSCNHLKVFGVSFAPLCGNRTLYH